MTANRPTRSEMEETDRTVKAGIDAIDTRYYLSGGRSGGVGICCRLCWDGGRPLGYYSDDPKPPYTDEPAVKNVTTISDLIGAALTHEGLHHLERPGGG